jgi:hypothetical protein
VHIQSYTSFEKTFVFLTIPRTGSSTFLKMYKGSHAHLTNVQTQKNGAKIDSKIIFWFEKTAIQGGAELQAEDRGPAAKGHVTALLCDIQYCICVTLVELLRRNVDPLPVPG